MFEIRGFRLSEVTKYSDGQPQLALQLSLGQPVHISGTKQHTKIADHFLDRIQHKHYGSVSVVLKAVSKTKFRYAQYLLDISFLVRTTNLLSLVVRRTTNCEHLFSNTGVNQLYSDPDSLLNASLLANISHRHHRIFR